jgi:hypothetical protein
MQGLHHDHRSDHVRRHRRPAPTRGKQVVEHGRREQPATVLSQKPEHAASRQQVTSDRRHIQQIPLILRTPLHTPTIPSRRPHTREARLIQRHLGAHPRQRRRCPTDTSPSQMRSPTTTIGPPSRVSSTLSATSRRPTCGSGPKPLSLSTRGYAARRCVNGGPPPPTPLPSRPPCRSATSPRPSSAAR